ncbi:MAG: nucleotide-binding protein [Candidatus Thorarchaeota archaeon]
MPIIVVLDTNILTVPAQFSVDIFAESERVVERRIEFVVLKSVIQELERKLEVAVRTEKFKFRIALDFVERCTVVNLDEVSSAKPVDDQVLEYAQSVNGVVATNDKELREKSLERGIPVLFMRGKKRLELQGTVR